MTPRPPTQSHTSTRSRTPARTRTRLPHVSLGEDAAESGGRLRSEIDFAGGVNATTGDDTAAAPDVDDRRPGLSPKVRPGAAGNPTSGQGQDTPTGYRDSRGAATSPRLARLRRRWR
jgi:hypothetical protein